MDLFILDRIILNFFVTMNSQKAFIGLLSAAMGVYLYCGAFNIGAKK